MSASVETINMRTDAQRKSRLQMAGCAREGRLDVHRVAVGGNEVVAYDCVSVPRAEVPGRIGRGGV